VRKKEGSNSFSLPHIEKRLGHVQGEENHPLGVIPSFHLHSSSLSSPTPSFL